MDENRNFNITDFNLNLKQNNDNENSDNKKTSCTNNTNNEINNDNNDKHINIHNISNKNMDSTISPISDHIISLNIQNNNNNKNLKIKNLYKIPPKKIKEMKPEFEKFKLQKSLFIKNSKIISENKDISLINKLNLESEPFVPKKKLFPENNEAESCFNYLFNCYKGAAIQAENYFKNANKKLKNADKRKKKKNKEFVEREGDWSCYRCKNLNFKFRNKCNKCGLNKDESEKKFVEIGEQLLKLADLTIYEKK